MALLMIFLALAAIYVVSGSAKGSHFGVADLIPSNWGLVVSGVLPVLMFLWMGLETQSSAAER